MDIFYWFLVMLGEGNSYFVYRYGGLLDSDGKLRAKWTWHFFRLMFKFVLWALSTGFMESKSVCPTSLSVCDLLIYGFLEDIKMVFSENNFQIIVLFKCRKGIRLVKIEPGVHFDGYMENGEWKIVKVFSQPQHLQTYRQCRLAILTVTYWPLPLVVKVTQLTEEEKIKKLNSSILPQ